jgi:hypothetical protein
MTASLCRALQGPQRRCASGIAGRTHRGDLLWGHSAS